MNNDDKQLQRRSSRDEVDAFLRQVSATPVTKSPGRRGRLIFALDATASREPTWDQAAQIQAEMFAETRSLGGLEIQLVYYRGFQELEASNWCANADDLLRRMTAVRCAAGRTQVARVLQHSLNEARREKVHALVFVGDSMEEDPDKLSQLAGQLSLLGLPAFVFHEGHDPIAERSFRQMAQLSGGAYCRFDTGSAKQLRDLLHAVAVYAAGGRQALENLGKRTGGLVRQLTHQLRKG